MPQVEQSLNGLMKTFKWSDSGRGVKWKDSIEEMMKWLKEQVVTSRVDSFCRLSLCGISTFSV